MKQKMILFIMAFVLMIASAVPVYAIPREALITAETVVTQETVQASSGSIVKAIVISIVIGLIIGAIVIASIISKYKPVHKNTAASDYLVGGSLQITGSYENFVRTQTTQREINTQNNQNNGQR